MQLIRFLPYDLFRFEKKITAAFPLLPLSAEYAHYENTPMQYTAIFHSCKNDNFQMKNFDIVLIFAKT